MSKVDGKRESKIKKSALKKVILSVICFILIISTCLGIVFIDKYNKMGEKVDEVPKETVASDKIYENNIFYRFCPSSRFTAPPKSRMTMQK